MTGRVVSVRDFGAFVDLGGGVQGLLHVSEMGWSRVADTSQMVKPGDEITVKVLRVDDDKQKISLGLKQLTRGSVVERRTTTYEVGQVLHGPRHAHRRVRRVRRTGAWRRRRWRTRPRSRRPAERAAGRSQVAAGMTGAFEVLSVDPDKKRIGVALLPEGSARAGGAAPSQSEIVPGARLTGKVERHEKFGVFVFLAPGRTGLIPLSETGVANEADIGKAFPVGSRGRRHRARSRRRRAAASVSASRRSRTAHEARKCASTPNARRRRRRRASDRSPTSCAAR